MHVMHVRHRQAAVSVVRNRRHELDALVGVLHRGILHRRGFPHLISVRSGAREFQAARFHALGGLVVGGVEVDHADRIVARLGHHGARRLVNQLERELAVFQRAAVQHLHDLRVDVAHLLRGNRIGNGLHRVTAERELGSLGVVRVRHDERIRAVAVVDSRHRGRVAFGHVDLAHRVLDGLAVGDVRLKTRPGSGPAVALVERLLVGAFDRHRLTLVVHVAQLRRHLRGAQAVGITLVVPNLRHVDVDRLQFVRVRERERVRAVRHAARHGALVALGDVRLLHRVDDLIAVRVACGQVVPGVGPVVRRRKPRFLARQRHHVALRVHRAQTRGYGIGAQAVGVVAVVPRLRHAGAHALFGRVHQREGIASVVLHRGGVAGRRVGFAHRVRRIHAAHLRRQVGPGSGPAVALIERHRVARQHLRLTRHRAVELRGHGRMHAGLRVALGVQPRLVHVHLRHRRRMRVHDDEARIGAARNR